MCGPFLLSYAASWTRPASVLFQTSGDHARMPRVRLLDVCGVRRLLDGGGITPACPASVQALRYYRAGGRANGRHPRRASPFLKF